MKKALVLATTAAEGNRLKIMLQELGIAEILTATDDVRAVNLAESHLPEVAIIDADAAGGCWLPVLKSLRMKRRLPVILLGGELSVDAVEEGVAAGAGGFLAKPLRKGDLWPAIEIAAMRDHELEALQERVAWLEWALESRKTIEKAKGVLMRQQTIGEPDAFRRMQKMSMDKRTTLLNIAEAILLTENGGGVIALR